MLRHNLGIASSKLLVLDRGLCGIMSEMSMVRKPLIGSGMSVCGLSLVAFLQVCKRDRRLQGRGGREGGGGEGGLRDFKGPPAKG